MFTQTPNSITRWRYFLCFLASIALFFSACQKEALEETNVIQTPPIVEPTSETDLRQLVLEQVFDIPVAKMEHPAVQQLATSFIENLSATERAILPTKIQALKAANQSQSSASRGAVPTPQTIPNGESLGFGRSLTQQGDHLIVGDNGAVHIYLQSNGTYELQQTITGNVEDEFGLELAITRNWLAVGAPFENEFAGAIYLYNRVDDQWVFTQKIMGESEDFLGFRLAMHGDNISGSEAVRHIW